MKFIWGLMGPSPDLRQVPPSLGSPQTPDPTHPSSGLMKVHNESFINEGFPSDLKKPSKMIVSFMIVSFPEMILSFVIVSFLIVSFVIPSFLMVS